MTPFTAIGPDNNQHISRWQREEFPDPGGTLLKQRKGKNLHRRFFGFSSAAG